MIAGAVSPLSALVYSDFLRNFQLADDEAKKSNATIFGLTYFGIAGLMFASILLEVLKRNTRLIYFNIFYNALTPSVLFIVQ